MSEENNQHIYSKPVVEFVTVAAEYVRFVENAGEVIRIDLLSKSQKLLPLLYLKASMLPGVEPAEEDELEKYVSEEDWNFAKNSVSKTLGEFDVWIEVNDPVMQMEEEGISVCVSECYADIYQDLSDFLQSYQLGTETIMNDALWSCKQSFEHYWGSRLLSSLNTLHQLIYGRNQLEEEADNL